MGSVYINGGEENVEPVICFEMIYADLDPKQRIERVAGYGFKAIEFWSWRDKDIESLAQVCAVNNVRVANFSAHRRGSLIAPETYPSFFEDLEESLSAARKLGCPVLMVLSNELGEGGAVREAYNRVPDREKYKNIRRGLESALERIPDDISLVLEVLNTKVDHPGYYLNNMSTAVTLMEEIDHPRLKILCDLYHMGVMGEDLDELIDRYLAYIGYFHVADFPGRHEPGTGSADWVAILKRIGNTGYQGPIGFEYSPSNDSDESLASIRSLWEEISN